MKALQAKDLPSNELFRILKEVEPFDFKDIISSPSPTFKAISEFHGKQISRSVIGVSLSEISKLLSFNITDEMIAECAKNIDIDFFDCKIDDMAFFKSKLMRNQLNTELYRNDALVLYKLFHEYYTQRADSYAEYFEQRAISQKNDEKSGIKSLYDNAPQWYRDNMDRIAEKMKIKNEEDVTVIPVQNMLLEEICFINKISYTHIAQKILYVAEQEFAVNDDKTLDLDFFKSVVFAKVQYEARKDPESLRKFLED